MDLFDLSGKVAIVTGGNGGLGRGMAQGLAAAGLSAEWHISQGVGHGIAEDGLELAAAFLRRALAGAMVGPV